MRKNNVLKMMLCIVMLCVVSAFAASASAASSSESEQFLQLINMERANAGVSAVTIGSQNLNDAAQARAQAAHLPLFLCPSQWPARVHHPQRVWRDRCFRGRSLTGQAPRLLKRPLQPG